MDRRVTCQCHIKMYRYTPASRGVGRVVHVGPSTGHPAAATVLRGGAELCAEVVDPDVIQERKAVGATEPEAVHGWVSGMVDKWAGGRRG